MKKRLIASVLAVTMSVMGITSAQAALIDRGGGMIYDDVLNITWLKDANYAATQFSESGGVVGDVDGRMSWADANAWAENLVFGGFDDWRLPTALNSDGSGPCLGFNCTGAELGYMFYTNMGATAGTSILGGSNAANLSLFSNLQSFIYWSGTGNEPDPSRAWVFVVSNGNQNPFGKNGEYHGWAVRAGDVGPPVPVPESGAEWLLLCGLGGLAAQARRRLGAVSTNPTK